MKKFLARFAVVGLFVGLAATSYALPASAATNDEYTNYNGIAAEAGPIEVSWVLDLEWSDYRIILVWREVIADGANGSETLAAGASDAMFNQ